LVNLLLEKGARPDAREKPAYKTALHEAVCRSLNIVRTLVDHGADINATHFLDRKTPLWWAFNCGAESVRAYLEEKGGRYRVYDGWYRVATPFEKAAADGDIEEMARMLAQGQYVNERDAFGDTAFHYAAAGGSVAAMQFLEENGGLPMFRGAFLRTPLFWAAFHGRIEACRYLMSRGCRLTDRASYDETPLHFAAKGNRVEVIKLFLEKGADVNASLKNDAPLAEAAAYNAAEAGRLLIENGAEINAHGDYGRTALHHAVLRGSADAVAVLLEHGADIHAGDKQGVSPLDFASAYRAGQGNSRVYVQMMAAAGKPVQPGFDCAQAATSIEKLICADLELAEMDAKAHTALEALGGAVSRAAAEQLEKRRQACVFSPYHYPEDDAFREAMKCLKTVYKEQLQDLKKFGR
jgi:ankyrin repeat protein